MFFRTKLPDGSPAVIIVGNETEARLRKTCFRGKNVAAAGNLRAWNNPTHMFQDDYILDPFVADVLKRVEAKEVESRPGDQHRATIIFRAFELMGWASTDDRSKYADDALERFEPNRKSSALRVLPNRTDLHPPETREITFVYSLRFERQHGWMVIIRTIYPGPDIGPLLGDLSQDPGVVFFSWDHPAL
jgi:hypothetical protein